MAMPTLPSPEPSSQASSEPPAPAATAAPSRTEPAPSNSRRTEPASSPSPATIPTRVAPKSSRAPSRSARAAPQDRSAPAQSSSAAETSEPMDRMSARCASTAPVPSRWTRPSAARAMSKNGDQANSSSPPAIHGKASRSSAMAHSLPISPAMTMFFRRTPATLSRVARSRSSAAPMAIPSRPSLRPMPPLQT